jgi:hypothetical protein
LGRGRDVAQGLQVLLRVLHDTTPPDLAAPDLELRLDQDDGRPRPRPAPIAAASRSFVTEMNDTSTVAMPAGLGHLARREVAGVDALEHDHARVPAQALVELAAAHVHGIDARGPALEQGLREAPVEAPTSSATRPRGSTPNASSAPSSLIAPRPTCSGPGSRPPPPSARTAVPALVAGWPSTRTRPAMTSACAFSRDSARPCSTSQTSSRRDVSAASRVPIDDEAGQAVQDRAPLAQGRDRVLRVARSRAAVSRAPSRPRSRT